MKEPVIVAEYDPRWPVMFEEEKTRLLGVIGHVVERVEHVGSTAVPGLGAKPIIDILIGLRRLNDAVQCIAPLQSLGYQYVPEYEVELPERRYFRKGSPRTHHIHMVELTSGFWERHLLFRDYLRAHPETVREYYELKKALAAKFGSDRDGYTDVKTEFVRSVEAEARSRL